MRTILLGGLAAVMMLGPAAAAQTAGDINRLNAAMQICSSPAGAGMAECARLRGQLGGGAGLGKGTAGAVGGLLGALSSARAAHPATVQPQVNTAVQQGVAACVKNAAGEAAAIQACLSSATARSTVSATARPGLGIGAYQVPAARAPAADTATAIHLVGQSYQACAAANPNNWQACLPLLNGGAR